MDGNLALSKVMQQKKEIMKKKKKQKSSKPIKVVYISNPMKIKASVSEFRALVQEFTGQYAEFPDPSKFPATDEDFIDVKSGSDDYAPDPVIMGEPGGHEVLENSISQYEPFDAVFRPDQMIENLSGFWPSKLLFESSQVDVLRGI